MLGKEVSFEEQITAIREFIAGVLEEEEDWGEAAKVCKIGTIRHCCDAGCDVLWLHAAKWCMGPC